MRTRGIKSVVIMVNHLLCICGFNEAKGDVVVTMDADLQDSPEEIRMVQNDNGTGL